MKSENINLFNPCDFLLESVALQSCSKKLYHNN